MVVTEVKKGNDPVLERPRFLVDHTLKQDVPSPYNLLVDGCKFIVWIGRPASGKTSHLFSLFKDKRILKKCWCNVILVVPLQFLQSINPQDNVFKNLSSETFYPDLYGIDDVKEQVKFYANDGQNSVTLIDNQMSHFKDPYIEKVLYDIVANRRHYRTSIILCSQLYERIPLRLRKLVNVSFIMFRPSKKEVSLMFDDLLEQKPDVSNDFFQEAV